MNRTVYAIATMDTKAEELQFLAARLRAANVSVKTIDVGTQFCSDTADTSGHAVLGKHAIPPDASRGEAIEIMSRALTEYMIQESATDSIAGVIGIGGSGGTALITPAMRALPIGLPKLMLSTVASGNTSGYVGSSDITMMFSVVDIAGLNVVSRRILANAAHAMAGMVQTPPMSEASRPCLGMTMFGVTTKCVTRVREQFEQDGYDGLVFHAVGTGGRAMENLVRSGLIAGVLDITTTEVADEVVGGIFAAGAKRFDATLEAEIPLVLSAGALDMVNYGNLESVPQEFRSRNLHVHNSQVTLMRTEVDENVAIGKWIANKLNQATSPFAVLLPERGLSALDAPGEPFHNPEANAALFETLEQAVHPDVAFTLQRLPFHINDTGFSEALVHAMRQLIAAKSPRY